MLTPSVAYNPILNLSPVGVFTAGLSTHPDLTWGAAYGLAGTNPNPSPDPVGFQFENWNANHTAFVWRQNHAYEQVFDPPLRLFPGGALAYQWRLAVVGVTLYLSARFLYREYQEE